MKVRVKVKNTDAKAEQSDTKTPFEQFDELARKLVAVPKKEIDEQAEKWKKRTRIVRKKRPKT